MTEGFAADGFASDGLFSRVELESGGRAGYRLDHLEVFNWGTFDKQVWRLTPGSETSLLTGDIGSGKSTLVDALTTLLMPAHRISYNKAAGAGSKERTLRSYVEGHYKSERIEATGRSRPIGLRSGGGTYSVVMGVFRNDGYDETVTLAQVFQQRDRAGQPYRFFVTATKALSIASDFADFGSELRDLRRRLRGAGAEVFDEFTKYSTSLRRQLGIRSEQALELFHQTVSMKSVGNLNDFVRDHMLEPSDATDRVRSIISHFEDLTKAHDAVKRAREQLEALDPVVTLAAKYDATLSERGVVEREQRAVRFFIAELRSGMLAEELVQLGAREEQVQAELDDVRAERDRLAQERESLIEERARAGGDRIGDLERLAREARADASERLVARAHFDEAVSEAGLEPVGSATGFAALSGIVARDREALRGEKRDLDMAVAEAIATEKSAERQRDALADELASLEQRTSNLPAENIDLREQLCVDLELTTAELPYAGELLDVYDDYAEWRGAAERVLRGFALSLLVPQQHYAAVSEWVNSRRLTVRGRGREGRGMSDQAAGSPAAGDRVVGARLSYERVPDRGITLQPLAGGALRLAECIEIRDGAFRDYLARELSKRADHRCAATLDEFRGEHRAVTREGQIRSGDRHDKDDRRRVDDPRRWVLGWANERKIAALRTEHDERDSERATAAAEARRLDERRGFLQARLDALSTLEAYRSWAQLDVAEAESRAAAHDEERRRLEAGSTRLAEITAALERNERQRKANTGRNDVLAGEVATTTKAAEEARRAKARDDELVSSHSRAELEEVRVAYTALAERLGSSRPTLPEECYAAESVLTDALMKRLTHLGKELGGYGQSLSQAMGDVLRRWPELGADLDTDARSRTEFVALRDRVAGDDLPRFEREFKDQLNKNAIQELAGFNNWLGRQAAVIDERVGKINEALGAVPYNPGRYIRLEKEATTNQEIAQFRSDLRDLTNDSLAADGDQYSEQRFLDVKRVIERFRGREGYSDSDKAWTRRVTDVRNWFVFSASEREMDTHEEREHYSDSDGKSGGQKEKLAYTILAASLAYQFGLEWGAAKSRDFRFAVIDEAFGRGSDASTRYALELFAKLGLQLLVVTPLQKVHVIEPFVKAIGFVDNPAGTFSRLQTMTIEEYQAVRSGRGS